MTDRHLTKKTIYLIIILTFCFISKAADFKSDFKSINTRHWPGESIWANRPQDWQLNKGRLECIAGTQPLRNVHLLTYYLSAKSADFQCSVELGMIEYGKYGNQDFAGFLIGSGSLDMDYRARATIFNTPGQNHGLAAVLNGDGWLMIYDLNNHTRPIPVKHTGKAFLLSEKNKVKLILNLESKFFGNYTIKLSLFDDKKKLIQTAVADDISAKLVTGDIGLISNLAEGENGKSFWFKNWTASGNKLVENETQAIGGIIGTLYTVSENVLRMTTQLQAVSDKDNKEIILEIKGENGAYKQIAATEICYPGWFGTFKVENWDSSKQYNYRVKYKLDGKEYYHSGIIRNEPNDKNKLKIAAFTGNNNFAGSFDDWKANKTKNYDFNKANIWYPNNDISVNVAKQNPDLLVWTGDQIYEHRPTKADASGKFSSFVDYLYKWSFFYLAHNKLLANYPSICLIDDHDVWQINLWGKGGAKSIPPKDGKFPKEYPPWGKFMWFHDQGYILPGEWINMVESSQMNHMPPPYDSEPVLQGILPKYGEMNYAGISFAFIEDRKHKSSPVDFVPESRPYGGHPTVKNYDIGKADKPGAKLYGDKQLAFIRNWAKNWKDCRMKIILSQTILANAQTGAGVLKEYPDESARIDFDSAGWPQTGRNKALSEIRKCFGFVIAGDQHLGSIIQHGIDDWNDSGYSFCVPAIGNQAPRRWTPNIKGNNHIKGMPRYTGEYLDGCKNKITVLAASNPWDVDVEPGTLYDRATGYGIITLDKKEQTIKMECWPRYADPNNPKEQYKGWPKTIKVEENYGRKALGYLPEIDLTNITNPVIQVINEKNNEIIYTSAVKNEKYSPKVFENSTYTIVIIENGKKIIETLKQQQIKGGNDGNE